MQRDVERVVGRGAVALDANVGGDRLRRSEQYQCLVEQVSAEVEPDAGAGQRLFTPCARPELGTETIKMGFERRDAAEDTFRQECLQRDEVTHVPAVVVDRQDPVLRGPELDKLVGLHHGGREWFVDHDVTSGQETLLRDRMMRCVGCGDDDQIDRPGEQLIDAAHEFDVCVARVRRAPPMTLDDGGEAETFDHTNHGRMECLTRKSETHESDVEHDRDSTSCPERGHLGGRWSHEQGSVLDVPPHQAALQKMPLESVPRRGVGYDAQGSELTEEPRLTVMKGLSQLRFETGGDRKSVV